MSRIAHRIIALTSRIVSDDEGAAAMQYRILAGMVALAVLTAGIAIIDAVAIIDGKF